MVFGRAYAGQFPADAEVAAIESALSKPRVTSHVLQGTYQLGA